MFAIVMPYIYLDQIPFVYLYSISVLIIRFHVWVWMQREAVEALIQELPKFRLKAVPTDCSECPICLEEFRVGNEVYFSKSN